MAYRVTVLESGITQIIQVGDGHRWLKAKAEQTKVVAVAMAPMRTGQLKRSHRVDQERGAGGRFQSGFRISATAPYAGYVHGGTRGMPGRWAKIPASRSATGAQVVKFGTRGQAANPWLERAARSVMGV